MNNDEGRKIRRENRRLHRRIKSLEQEGVVVKKKIKEPIIEPILEKPLLEQPKNMWHKLLDKLNKK